MSYFFVAVFNEYDLINPCFNYQFRILQHSNMQRLLTKAYSVRCQAGHNNESIYSMQYNKRDAF